MREDGPEDILKTIADEVDTKVQDDEVLLALSGGVDSVWLVCFTKFG